jgi:hypothetical protein
MAKFIVVVFAILSLNLAQAQQPGEEAPQGAIPNAAIVPKFMIPQAIQPNQVFAVPQAARVVPPVVNLGEVVINVVIAKVLGSGDQAELTIAKFGGKEANANPRVVTTYQTETRMRNMVVNGETKAVTYTVQVPVTTVVNAKENFTPTEQDRSVPVSTVQAFDLKGSPIGTADWIKRLENPRHVLLLREPINESNKLNPFYSSILREDMLLLFLKGVPVEAPRILISYNVKDLPVWSKDGEDLDPNDFVNLIKSKVAPKAWSTNASMQPNEKDRSIVVSANQAIHEELAEFFRGQREEMAKQARQ